MKRLLVIDNNEMMLEFMRELLEGEGYEIRTAGGGLEALEILTEYKPDMIFVDLVMPEIDGKRLCRLMRTREPSRSSYIVVLSAIAAEDRELDVNAYADAYVAKAPFKVLKGNILTLLRDFEAGETDKYSDTVVGLDSIYTREITKELLYSRRHMDEVLTRISDGFLEITEDNYTIIYGNPAAADFAEVPEEELISSSFLDLFDPYLQQYIRGALEGLNGSSCELGEQKDIYLGSRQLLLKCTHMTYDSYSSILVLMEDISARKRSERQMLSSLNEKELFLNEIHHRVKNNFQIISSILNLQQGSSSDKDVREVLRISQNRIDAMSLIHENISHSRSMTKISVQEYLQDLLNHLVASYGAEGVKIEVEADYQLSLATAIPLGLMVNELASNSFIYGKNGDDPLRLMIHLETYDDTTFLLTVRDNGTGFPDNFLQGGTDSLGLLIVNNLAHQLGGKVSYRTDGGALTTIRFPAEE